MKKFTFMLVAAFMAALTYADAARPVRTMASHAITGKTLQQTAMGKTTPMRMAKKAATLPENAKVEEYTLRYMDYYGELAYGSLYIAFDGSDVYMQGLCNYLPEVWIQGKLDGDSIRFAGNQSFGTYAKYEFFFQEEEAVFFYDANNGTLVLEGVLYTYYDDYYCDYYEYPMLTRVVESAAKPASPMIIGIEATQYGDIVVFTVPTVDEQGNGLVTSKLTYQFYIEEKGEVSPLTFKVADYKKLEEDLTVIPYGFSENYDFYNGQIYLNMDHSTWNKIGIKSTYTGGGETNETEIQWYVIENNTPIVNGGTWVAAEQGYENGEDVTEITIDEGITGVLDKGDGKNAPKYYEVGTSLRMYAGNTLTITSVEPLTMITFTFDTSKNPSFEVSTGEIDIDGETGVWTGNATEIVFTVPNVSGTQSRIQKIVIGEGGVTPEPEPELVVLPEGVTADTWYFAGVADGGDADFEVKVAIDGTDMYIQGLAGDYLPEAWVKGTISGTTVTFKNGQYLGEYESWSDTYSVYLMGYNSAEEVVEDLKLVYDAENSRLTTTQYVLLNTDQTDIALIDYYYDVEISKQAPVMPELVVVPEGIEIAEYKVNGKQWVEDEETEDYVQEVYAESVFIGFNGNDVYFKGLAVDCPEGWAKGTLSADGKTITLPKNQYLGTVESFFGSDSYFVTSYDEEKDDFADVVFDYDAQNATLTAQNDIIINGSSRTLLFYDWLTDITISKLADVAATPADPAVAGFGYYTDYGFGYVKYNIPTWDTEGNDILTSKLSYQVMIEDANGNVAPLKLTTDLYKNVEEDTDIIPYTFSDDYDIYNNKLYLNQPLEEISSWKKIGVKSVYYGGGETRESQIGWYDLAAYWETSGVAAVKAEGQQVSYYDLQGRKASASARGMLIRQTRMADGSVKYQKVMVK